MPPGLHPPEPREGITSAGNSRRLFLVHKHCDARYGATRGLNGVEPMGNESWNEQLRRGGLELAILLVVAPGTRYGLEIIRHLQAFTDLVVTEGTIYPILGRLTRDGLLEAEWQASAAHPRNYHKLTGTGRE